MNTIKILLLSFILIFVQQIVANNVNEDSEIKNNGKDTSNFLFEHKDLQFTFLFPVIGDEIKLKVTIPKNFKPLEGNPEAELLEFIPNTDKDPYQWSEIISLTKILGTGITAKEYISKMEELFKENVDARAKVLEREQHSYDGYQDASSIIQYHTEKRDEIVILYSVSGPLDIANVQYALPLPSSPSSEMVRKTVQKLHDFIKNNLEVMKDEKSMKSSQNSNDKQNEENLKSASKSKE